MPFGSSWGLLGGSLGALGRSWVGPLGLFGGPWVSPGGPWEALGRFLAPWELIGVHFGAALGDFWLDFLCFLSIAVVSSMVWCAGARAYRLFSDPQYPIHFYG